MIITNDVSLLTFVPFYLCGAERPCAGHRRALTIPVVCMQTIAANLGSMLTPIGNPQNLYLYGKKRNAHGGVPPAHVPHTVVSLLLLVGWAVMVCRKQASSCIGALPEQPNTTADRENHPAGCGAVCGLSAGGRPGIALRRCLFRCAGLYPLR